MGSYQATPRKASTRCSRVMMWFQLILFWATSLRSPGTHAARFSAAICRNQLDSWFQLLKIWVTLFNFARVGAASLPTLIYACGRRCVLAGSKGDISHTR